MHLPSRSPYINIIANAIIKASRPLLRDFGEVENLQVSSKGTKGFVTSADMRAEKILREELSKAKPTFGFLLEESGSIAGEDSQARWLVDPLDGTTNFIHGIPHFAISVALEVNGEIIAAVTYDPVRAEMFWAEKGGGTFLNNRRLRVSGRRNLPESLLGTCNAASTMPHPDYHENLQKVESSVAGIRRLGAATLDLAYVAAGRYEGFWQARLEPWDMAAGILMVREAGGYVTDLNGETHMFTDMSIVAGNEFIHPLLIKTFQAK